MQAAVDVCLRNRTFAPPRGRRAEWRRRAHAHDAAPERSDAVGTRRAGKGWQHLAVIYWRLGPHPVEGAPEIEPARAQFSSFREPKSLAASAAIRTPFSGPAFCDQW